MFAARSLVRAALLFGSLAGLAATSDRVAAQSRPVLDRLTCTEAQNLVQRSGEIVLSTGAYTYDRYVAHRGYCPQETTRATFERTRDNPQCFVGYTCRGQFSRGGN